MADKDREALRYAEETHARDAAVRARDSIAQAVRAAEQACFPLDMSALRSRDPQARNAFARELDASRRTHPIAARFVALDEEGRILLPDPRLPFRSDAPGLDG